MAIEPFCALTEQEKNCLLLLTSGRSDVDIAQELSTSDHMVRLHILAAQTKLSVLTRAQAIVAAMRRGQI